MKIGFGNWKFETPAKLLVVAVTIIVLAALYFAAANFQSLELSGSFSLQARPSCPSFPSVKSSAHKIDNHKSEIGNAVR